MNLPAMSLSVMNKAAGAKTLYICLFLKPVSVKSSYFPFTYKQINPRTIVSVINAGSISYTSISMIFFDTK